MKTARVIIAVIIASLVFPASLSADTCSFECQWYTYEGCGYEMWVCHPEYYVWQSVEPDWCLYSTGDYVDIRYQNFQPVAWYVVPHDGTPTGSWYVVNNQYGCFLITL